ncbi:MAG: DsbA family protein [Anaerolineales bacterium]|nr:MAG: DsbA family protein [Anaerolineales bacterium]
MAKKQQASKSKRQIIREQRLRRQRQQRLITILAVSIGAIAIAAILIIPSLTPVGEIIQITPVERPMVDGTALGEDDAPVLVEVWEDFQCPACRNFSEDVEPQIVDNYVATGKVRYVYRHYPFLDDRSISNESDQAANASMCAAEQGRFWDYHDILFANWNSENAGAFSDKRLVAYAEALGLDMDSFNSCFRANRYKEQIDKDLADGNVAGVSGTPSLFVNGEQIAPGFVPSYAQVSQAIETALASSGN